MASPKLQYIEVGQQVYAEDGGEVFGAVRQVAPEGRDEVVIDIENAGDFTIPASAIRAVHSGKVILDVARLDARVREAIAHAHDREVPGL